MKNLVYLFILILIFSNCSKRKDCPPCFTSAHPFRFVLVDEKDNNLLDPNFENKYEVKNIVLNNEEYLSFELTKSIGGVDLNYYFIEVSKISAPYTSPCYNKKCKLTIYYKNHDDLDIFELKLKKKNVKMNEFHGCDCTVFYYPYIKHNGNIVKEYDLEHKTGSTIIRK